MKKNIYITVFILGVFLIGNFIYSYYPKKVEVSKIVKSNIEKEFYEMQIELPENVSEKYPEIFDFTSKQISDFDKEYGNLSLEEVKSVPDGFGKYQFFMKTNIATTSNSISYVIETYIYTGGAHGGTSVSTFNYNNKGKLISAKDLFKVDDWKKIISEKSRTYFQKKFEDEGFLDKDTLFSGTEPNQDNFNTWFLRGNEIVFVFGEYSIGSYALGIQEFSIQKDEILDILKNIF